MSLNGDRIVESMGGIVAEEPAWWGVGVPCGSRGKELTRRQGARTGRGGAGGKGGKEEGVAGRLHLTLNPLHLTLRTLHSTLYTLHLTLHTWNFPFHTPLYTLHFTLYTLHSTLRTAHSTLYTLHFTLYTLHTTLYTLHSIPYTTLHTTFYTLHFPHYTLHSTLHTLHCTLYTLPPPPGISIHLQPSPCRLLCLASLQLARPNNAHQRPLFPPISSSAAPATHLLPRHQQPSATFAMWAPLLPSSDPIRPRPNERTPAMRFYTLHSTLTLPAPELQSVPCLFSFHSLFHWSFLILPLLFLCFDSVLASFYPPFPSPPNARPWTGQGGNRSPPSTNCHMVHRPQWPPELAGEVPQNGPFWGHRPPDPLFSLRSQWATSAKLDSWLS